MVDATQLEFWLGKFQVLMMDYGVKILTALLIVLLGRWLAKKITNIALKLMTQRGVEITLSRFLDNIIYYTLLAMVLITALGQLGVQTASFVAILGAASLAVALALKDSLSHFSSGVMLILFRPFKVGDFVTVSGESGTVEAVTIFNTVLKTPDNQRKIIPNGQVYNSTITNVTVNPTRRVDVTVGIGYDDDIRAAKEVLEGLLAKHDKVFSDPAPLVAVSALGASSVDLVTKSWVNTSDYWTVYYALTEEIKLAFDEAGISIPFPQQDVHLFTNQAEQKE
ncbi:mechanosensitive ion channel family protein [Desulfotalea psychrophila]|uniref:Conserved hypothetical membrane protein n=1 Tax=Desulfotalea psychrophila (strain LSv54 / DSM 12343) TaxID=177439 RepID=Q6APU0_DESPS|nr:mechanosensitive ion channel domain-containing protein [Desulfotalea psychrophila]CAG35634.1 conserved hypothetical membrane protein [Desulfotalea psychrophila LSv54]